jgi:hypothetical protein
MFTKEFIEEMKINVPEWMMSLKERIGFVSIVANLRPKTALEVGCWEGGHSRWIKKYCESLCSVDAFKPKPAVDCEFISKKSDEAFAEFIAQGRKFDYIVIDADHNTEPAYKDLNNAIQIGKVITMHDSLNEICRAGYKKAIFENRNKIVYSELDFVTGQFIPAHDKEPDGNWGGLGLVITKN